MCDPGINHPLLPAPCGPSDENSSSDESPRCCATCVRQSFEGNPANRMCTANQIPSGAHGSHSCSVSPVSANSGARSAPPGSAWFTPSTYAVTHSRVSSSSDSKHRCAVSANRACRANTSHATASAPRNAALVPRYRRRSSSSCQARSCAAFTPCRYTNASGSPACRCGTPYVSRNTLAFTNIPHFS